MREAEERAYQERIKIRYEEEIEWEKQKAQPIEDPNLSLELFDSPIKEPGPL